MEAATKNSGGDATADQDAVVVRTLGAFEVYAGGAPVEVPPGLPTQAIKLVISRGGHVHAEVLADELWPHASAAEQRKAVRNVLGRLVRADCGVLVRDGEIIRLAPFVVVDSIAFRTAADRVLLSADRPADAAAAVVAKYGGDYLPDDLYAEWAENVREQLRRRQIALIDLLVTDAQQRGACLEAVALLEAAIEIDPSDDLRYLEAAEVLAHLGRRGRAATLLERALGVLREFGLEPGPAWHRIDGLLRAAPAPEDARQRESAVSRIRVRTELGPP